MTAPVPQSSPRVWLARLFWLVTGLGAWVVIVLSAWLSPDARGFGTHQQLGLPPCSFEAMTRVPCPGCGLTTSFASMAHGRILQAFGAHLMGPFLFLITLGFAVATPWAVRKGTPVSALVNHNATPPVLMVTLAAGLITFALRLVHRFI